MAPLFQTITFAAPKDFVVVYHFLEDCTEPFFNLQCCFLQFCPSAHEDARWGIVFLFLRSKLRSEAPPNKNQQGTSDFCAPGFLDFGVLVIQPKDRRYLAMLLLPAQRSTLLSYVAFALYNRYLGLYNISLNFYREFKKTFLHCLRGRPKIHSWSVSGIWLLRGKGLFIKIR